MRKTIILLAGPPESGKDEVAKIIALPKGQYNKVHHLKMAEPLKIGGLGLLGLPISNEFAERVKPQTLKSTTPIDSEMIHREFWIFLSEEVIKPKFGRDFFGKILAQKIQSKDGKAFVISDSGFLEEALPLYNTFGIEDVFLFQLEREGKTFAGDSRSYWEPPEGAFVKRIFNKENNLEGTANEILYIMQARLRREN